VRPLAKCDLLANVPTKFTSGLKPVYFMNPSFSLYMYTMMHVGLPLRALGLFSDFPVPVCSSFFSVSGFVHSATDKPVSF